MVGAMGALPRALEAARHHLAVAETVESGECRLQIELLIAYLLIQSGELAQAKEAYDAIPIGKEPGKLKQQFIQSIPGRHSERIGPGRRQLQRPWDRLEAPSLLSGKIRSTCSCPMCST